MIVTTHVRGSWQRWILMASFTLFMTSRENKNWENGHISYHVCEKKLFCKLFKLFVVTRKRISSKNIKSTGSKLLEHSCDCKRFFCYKKFPSFHWRNARKFELRFSNFSCFEEEMTYVKIPFLIPIALSNTVAGTSNDLTKMKL